MNERRAFWTTLALLALVKAGFLVALGPVTLPDSSDYVLFAEAILAGGDWARELDLSEDLIPLTAFRVEALQEDRARRISARRANGGRAARRMSRWT